MVTIKRNLDIKLNGEFFAKAHLGKIVRFAERNQFSNSPHKVEADKAKYYLEFIDGLKFGHYRFFSSLNQVRQFIRENF